MGLAKILGLGENFRFMKILGLGENVGFGRKFWVWVILCFAFCILHLNFPPKIRAKNLGLGENVRSR